MKHLLSILSVLTIAITCTSQPFNTITQELRLHDSINPHVNNTYDTSIQGPIDSLTLLVNAFIWMPEEKLKMNNKNGTFLNASAKGRSFNLDRIDICISCNKGSESQSYLCQRKSQIEAKTLIDNQAIEFAKLIIAALGMLVGIITLYKAIKEYLKQSITKRMEVLIDMRTRLRQDTMFSTICGLLESDSEELKTIPLIEKDRFIGFFEELALIKNSGLINNEVALYMFGYYAEKCLDSKNFWYQLNKDQPLWKAFFDFAKDMKNAHATFEYKKSRFRL